MNVLNLIGRNKFLFQNDLNVFEQKLFEIVRESRFLVIGGAGSIGQAVTLEIFKRDPKVLHVVDISENNMVELVRNIRSTIGYGSVIFELLLLIVEVLNMKLFSEMKVHMTMS